MLGLEFDASERLELAFVVVDVEVRVGRSACVNTGFSVSEVAMAMLFFQSDVDDARSSLGAVLGGWVCHHLDAFNGFGRELTEYLCAVVGVHAHLFAVDPHKDIGVAAQGYFSVAVDIDGRDGGKKFIGRCACGSDVGTNIENPVLRVDRQLAFRSVDDYFLKQL